MEFITDKHEIRIAKAVVDALLAKGWIISVWEAEDWALEHSIDRDQILKAMGSTVMDKLCAETDDCDHVGWVMLIWGNGEDLISDNTESLTEVLEGIR